MSESAPQPKTSAAAEQRRRLETLGRLAGSVVHDFNNLLMVIDSYARMMLEEPQLSSNLRESATEILGATERASSLTGQLLAITRKKSPAPVTLDLNGQLVSMRSLLERLLGETVLLDYELSAEPVYARGQNGQLEQIVLNLIINARDAMPVGGRVVMRTRRDGGSVCLEVEDNGEGIPAHLAGQIFEPFFTTKPEGKGTGIGLSLVSEIVAEWGGTIEVASQPGRGARFLITLPSVSPAAKSSGTILVAEDEDAVRTRIRRALEQQGYQVLEAASEAAAIEVIHGATQLNLLITDLELKGGNGRNVRAKLLAAHPSARVLYISGYLQEPPPAGELALQKPFSPKALVLAVQDLLESQ